jgi:hypothetical protein
LAVVTVVVTLTVAVAVFVWVATGAVTVVKAVAVAVLRTVSNGPELEGVSVRKAYTVAGVTVFLKNEEQSCEADAGPGFALLAITALRQLSRAHVGLTDCAAGGYEVLPVGGRTNAYCLSSKLLGFSKNVLGFKRIMQTS